MTDKARETQGNHPAPSAYAKERTVSWRLRDAEEIIPIYGDQRNSRRLLHRYLNLKITLLIPLSRCLAQVSVTTMLMTVYRTHQMRC